MLELASFFFEPIELHLQPADLAIQLVFPRLGFRQARVGFPGKHFGQPFGHLLLPLAHLHRVDLVLRGDRVHWLDALQGLKTNPSAQKHVTQVETLLGVKLDDLYGLLSGDQAIYAGPGAPLSAGLILHPADAAVLGLPAPVRKLIESLVEFKTPTQSR